MTVQSEKFSRILQKNNLSVTAARKAIFATLLASDRPLKNGEVATRTKSVNRTSVYRTLDLFDRLGITTTVVRGWTPFVELAEPFKPHHHHLQCTHCQQLIALNTPELEQLVEQLAKKHNYALSSHHIELEGLCAQCQRLSS